MIRGSFELRYNVNDGFGRRFDVAEARGQDSDRLEFAYEAIGFLRGKRDQKSARGLRIEEQCLALVRECRRS